MAVTSGVTLGRQRILELDADVVKASAVVVLPTYTVAGLPDAADWTGGVVYVSNGAAGSPILAFSDGTNWKRSDTDANVAA